MNFLPNCIRRAFIAIFFIFIAFQVPLYSQETIDYKLSTDTTVNRKASFRRTYYATRTSTRPKIDGKLNDPCWNEVGIWAGDFTQQAPHQGAKPSQPTEIKILYDDQNLYIAVRCFDSEKGKIRSIMSKRDEFGGDITGVALDTYHDKQTAVEFNVSAAGQKIDLQHLGAYKWDFNWNAVWEGRSSVNDTAWCAEMRVPFNQLRFNSQEEQVWGMHIWRWIDRFHEESQWKLIPIDAPAMVYLFGELRGIKGIKHKKNFEIMPYGSLRVSPNASPNREVKFGGGVDGKIGLTSNFTLDYTLNPDFGQVEADPSVLNLSAYETFYDEKRPFFLEGNSILGFNADEDRLFYTRRIGHAPSFTPGIRSDQQLVMPENTTIINALKLTGRTPKGLSLGFVQSFTAREWATVYNINGKERISVEPLTSYVVGRVKQEFNQGNTVLGGMMTSTVRDVGEGNLNFLPHSALTGGVDLDHNWMNRKYFLEFKSFFSQIKGSNESITALQQEPTHYYQRIDAPHLSVDPTRTRLSGSGGNFDIGKRSGKLRLSTGISWRSPGVDLNDVGYLYQADYISQRLGLLYKVDKAYGQLLNFEVGLDQKHQWSFGGENLVDQLNFHAMTRFKNFWTVTFQSNAFYNNFDTRALRGGPRLYIDPYCFNTLNLTTNTAKKAILSLTGQWDFGKNNSLGRNRIEGQVKGQLTNSLSTTLQVGTISGVNDNQYVNTVQVGNQTQWLEGRIHQKTLYTTLRLEYYLSPEFSLQYYGSPYASIGHFSKLRKVVDGSNRDAQQRFHPLTILGEQNSNLLIDSDGNGSSDLQIANPDFNFQEFRSNLVGRWEFHPGSTIYLVWTNTRSMYQNHHEESVAKSFGDLFSLKSQNLLMIKLNYWFSI